MFLLGVNFGEGGKPVYLKKNPSGWDWLKLSPRKIAEMGGRNVAYNANLALAHPDINLAKQHLTSAIKWEPVSSLGQAVYPEQMYMSIV